MFLRSEAEYVNSPTRRNPAKAMRAATARLRSFFCVAESLSGWTGRCEIFPERFMTETREIGLRIRFRQGGCSRRVPSTMRRKCFAWRSRIVSGRPLSMWYARRAESSDIAESGFTGGEPPAPSRRSVSQVQIAGAVAGHGCTPIRAQLRAYERCAERYTLLVPSARPFQTSFAWPAFTKIGCR